MDHQKHNFNVGITIDNNAISNAVQKAVSSFYSSKDIENKIMCYAGTKINKTIKKWEQDGSLTRQIAKQVASQISVQDIMELLDVEELKEKIVDRVSLHLISKLKLNLLNLN